MITRFSAVALLLGLVGVLCAACAPSSGPNEDASSVIVVGVQSDPMGGLVGGLTVRTSVAGVPQANEDVVLPAGGTLEPKEFRLSPPAGNPSATVDVTIEGYTTRGGPPVLVRSASTSFVQGKTKLLRMHLESRCVLAPPGATLGGPECGAGQTCKAGQCLSSAVAEAELEEYAPNWATNAPDICKPVGHGEPQVVVGTGQTDYLPIAEGQKLQVELGPQGGHHVWIAARMRNLKQSGSTTTITAVQPTTGTVVPPTAFVFTFDRDEGGFCKLFGLRYQLDNGAADLKNDYKKYLGKPLDITIEVADQAGARTKSTVHAMIDTNILCPTGIPNCT